MSAGCIRVATVETIGSWVNCAILSQQGRVGTTPVFARVDARDCEAVREPSSNQDTTRFISSRNSHLRVHMDYRSIPVSNLVFGRTHQTRFRGSAGQGAHDLGMLDHT